MNNSCVSVIVPVYNVEKYLSDCINSIISQNYKNLQIILIDDGSTDTSSLICDQFAMQDQRITVVHQQNVGVAESRNIGLSKVKGDYIFFVDSDDILVDGIIERMVYLVEKNQVDIAVCNSVTCNESAKYDNLKNMSSPEDEEKIEIFDETKMYEYLIGSKIKVVVWGKLYKKHIFNDIKFPQGKVYEDNATSYKLVHAANKVLITSRIGYVYRMNNNSITHQSFSPMKLNDLDSKIEQRDFILNNYPKLTKYANAGIIYGSNQVLLSMIDSDVQDVNIFNRLRDNYRKYIFDYLKSKASIKGKVFAMLASCSVGNLYKLLSLIKSYRHR